MEKPPDLVPWPNLRDFYWPNPFLTVAQKIHPLLSSPSFGDINPRFYGNQNGSFASSTNFCDVKPSLIPPLSCSCSTLDLPPPQAFFASNRPSIHSIFCFLFWVEIYGIFQQSLEYFSEGLIAFIGALHQIITWLKTIWGPWMEIFSISFSMFVDRSGLWHIPGIWSYWPTGSIAIMTTLYETFMFSPTDSMIIILKEVQLFLGGAKQQPGWDHEVI